MNYLIMDQMKEYESEFDSMLFHLPLAGSTFQKSLLRRTTWKSGIEVCTSG